MKLPGLDRFEVGLEEARFMGLDKLLGHIEYWMIRLALKRSGGSRAAAARMLRIKRTTLVMKCKKHGIAGKIKSEH